MELDFSVKIKNSGGTLKAVYASTMPSSLSPQNSPCIHGLNDDFLVKLKKEKSQFRMNTSIAQMHAHITMPGVVLVQLTAEQQKQLTEPNSTR